MPSLSSVFSRRDICKRAVLHYQEECRVLKISAINSLVNLKTSLRFALQEDEATDVAKDANFMTNIQRVLQNDVK
jgi:hypothetical protein